ncbi:MULTISPECIES: hemerythrin domain-containing protein [unclassified Actinopolyspora]|uniref:hemerythrin domain-containing protein n=1 Tax=Actinopolyspora TaxID=1849 RepID=UPI0013F5A408|nr:MULTISPECIES: hemerythrin domain-containing protein [unclassified Actinopolyspora]NHD15830.1 hemerythrin domain-containing protein [Actinopolyspora sp. BKK2]NHE74956.1 hemerythrin domain-containing protein [Actinopolyspora sp. BKK1]
MLRELVTNEGDLIDIVDNDHRTLERAFAEYENDSGDSWDRRGLVEYITAEMIRHMVAEEEYLYPAVQEKLPELQAAAERELSEHARFERELKALEMTPSDQEEFDRRARALFQDFRQHTRGEERELLPRLHSACSARQLLALGSKITMVRSVAPTRPHPAAPDHSPANMLLNPGMGLVDRVRDALFDKQR